MKPTVLYTKMFFELEEIEIKLFIYYTIYALQLH